MVKNRNVAFEDPPEVKKNPPLEDPPSASSTDEEEDTSDSSSDNKDEPSQNPSTHVSAAKEVSNSDSSSDDDVTESAKPKLKRPSEEASASVNAKRVKKEIEPETETKKAYFQRLWSEEDEIVILKGMIKFKSETGKIPSENMNRFYESVKKSITYEAKNLNQFISKIHSLKKKFNAKMKKGDKLSFAKPHDEKCFELSKSIWRADLESIGAKSVAAKPKSKKHVKVEYVEPEGEEVDGNWFENSFIVGSIVSFGMDEESVKSNWSLVPMEVKKKIQEKRKVLEGKRLKFALDKIALVHEVASVLP